MPESCMRESWTMSLSTTRLQCAPWNLCLCRISWSSVTSNPRSTTLQARQAFNGMHFWRFSVHSIRESSKHFLTCYPYNVACTKLSRQDYLEWWHRSLHKVALVVSSFRPLAKVVPRLKTKALKGFRCGTRS